MGNPERAVPLESISVPRVMEPGKRKGQASAVNILLPSAERRLIGNGPRRKARPTDSRMARAADLLRRNPFTYGAPNV